MLPRAPASFTYTRTHGRARAHTHTRARSPYNLVDVGVIALSLIALGPVTMPVSVLRVIRAFRVIRIFGRLAALRSCVCARARARVVWCWCVCVCVLL